MSQQELQQLIDQRIHQAMTAHERRASLQGVLMLAGVVAACLWLG